MSSEPAFTFVDLFAGIGGFHAALSALGGECVYAVEKDPDAARVYELNWGINPLGDIVEDTEGRMAVPKHDVLAAGFPCQPFSKSGFQRGMDEARGTLFWNICEILRVRKPTVVLLENVRNIAGPRHAHEWDVIIRSLRELGYQVSSKPIVFSPHLLPPERGGRPQVRERVFIVGTFVGKKAAHVDIEPAVAHTAVDGWDPQSWNLREHLPLEEVLDARTAMATRLSAAESTWIDAWDDFVVTLRSKGVTKLPGFPVWVDAWVHEDDLSIPPGTPAWKENFLRKNAAFYTEHLDLLEAWLSRWDYLRAFPASRRKFEWQAQDAASLDETLLHLRPSGLRAKKDTYAPALVAITQTSVLGRARRRMTPREGARLQGLPEWFSFGEQSDKATYKQVGNGVNVGAAYHVFVQHVLAADKRPTTPARREKLRALAHSIADATPDTKLDPLVPPRVRSPIQRAAG
jgi:DNA (cytosine-5)-methyltransferase 1